MYQARVSSPFSVISSIWQSLFGNHIVAILGLNWHYINHRCVLILFFIDLTLALDNTSHIISGFHEYITYDIHSSIHFTLALENISLVILGLVNLRLCDSLL
jgi:hypothetical protein